jgi:hypothetical protein
MGRRKLSDKEIKAAADRAEGKATPSDEAATEALGRPAEYKPAYAEQVKTLCKLGATDIEIAEFFGVNEVTFYRWKAKYPDFCKAVRSAKQEADERVERSLYHRAVGYTFSSEKVFQYCGEIIRAKTKEHFPPDTAACTLWLKNRRPDQWRDKIDASLSVSGEVRFVVEGAPAMKTIEAVAGDR